ncbi:MAG: HAMP domain-containing sensor histidine kinase [Dermatophilaceae bacterium]
MTALRVGLGPLGRRLLLAFVLVAASSVLVLTVAALIGVGQGFQAAAKVNNAKAAASAATAAADAYRKASGWDGADLNATSAVAAAAGAKLFVLDAANAPVGGASSGGVHLGPGQGKGTGPVGGLGVVNAPVVVDRVSVGTVRLVFETATGNQARDVAWSWIAVAALVALLVALLASWVVTRLITRPIQAMTAATRAFSAGDRQARAAVHGPGELGELAFAFDSMADTVARSERDRRNLTADVAHELRTPLAALQAGLEELRDGLVEPSAAGLAGLHDQSLRLGRVVSDLAELSAVEAGGVPVRRTEVDLTQVARDELAAHDSQLRAAGLSVSSRLDGPVVVSADSGRLHQALGNLLANAARYCRPGDEVAVGVRTQDGLAVVEVVDSGPGIPSDELPHVFDRLWRGRAANAVAGSGIGLAVAREIVVAHGGTIEAVSPETGGTTIAIRIPRSAQAHPA